MCRDVPSGSRTASRSGSPADGANQAYNGGVYGIITASGINVNGQSLSAQQEQASGQLYAAGRDRSVGTHRWVLD